MHPRAQAPRGPRSGPDAGHPGGSRHHRLLLPAPPSHDNPYAESFFATFKTRFDYPGSGFESLQQAQKHVSAFVEWYNHEHLHQGLNYVTPMQRRRGEEGAIFARRREVTEAYRKDHPERWHGRPVRSWNLPQRIRLGYGDEPELVVPPLQISGESADCSFLKTM